MGKEDAIFAAPAEAGCADGHITSIWSAAEGLEEGEDAWVDDCLAGEEHEGDVVYEEFD